MSSNTTDKNFADLATMLLSNAHRFTFFRAFCHVMKVDEALFLQDLIDRSQSPGCKKTSIKVNGETYILCTDSFLSNPKYPPVYSERQRKRLLLRMKEKGYIKIHHGGLPCRRYIHVDVMKILGDVNEAASSILVGYEPSELEEDEPYSLAVDEPSDETYSSKPTQEKGGMRTAPPPLPDPPSPSNGKASNGDLPAKNNGNPRSAERRTTPRSRNGKGPLTEKPVDPQDLDTVKELKDGIRSAGGEFTSESMKADADHIAKIRKLGKSIDLVLRLFLKIYRRRREYAPLPTISSCCQFRKQFDWIEDRMREIFPDKFQAEEEEADSVKYERVVENGKVVVYGHFNLGDD